MQGYIIIENYKFSKWNYFVHDKNKNSIRFIMNSKTK